MVSPSKLNHSRVANVESQHHSTSKCKLLKGTRPLLNHKFFLDIEKHQLSSKIELKIKELGGSVEFFFDKNVTHFITDRQLDRNRSLISSPQTPHTPLTPFRNENLIDASAVVTSPTSAIGAYNAQNTNSATKQTFSRADAILQKARINSSLDYTIIDKKTQPNCIAPFYLAKSWSTPIWTTEYALKFLAKVALSLKSTQITFGYSGKCKLANLKHLRGDYIKIETFDKYHRPYYKEIDHWPVISLVNLTGDSPFVYLRSKTTKITNITTIPVENDTKATITTAVNTQSRMTRKNRSKQTRIKKDLKRSSEKQCGYCEICRLEYDTLSAHLQSAEHLNFVQNNDNFMSLDTLINDRTNVDAFLEINETPANFIDNEFFGKRSSGRLMAKLIRSCENDVKSGDYDIRGDLQNLRNQLSTQKRFNNRQSEPLIRYSTKEPNPVKNESNSVATTAIPKQETGCLRSRRESVKRINYDESLDDEENGEENSKDLIQKKIKKIRLRGVRWRAPSPNNNIPATLPIVYKVVNETKSLKSPPTKCGTNRGNSVSLLSEQNKSEGIKVKICRVRESELARLTNEADHFMFPRIFSDYPTDDDRQSVTSFRIDDTADLSSSSDEEKSSVKNEIIPVLTVKPLKSLEQIEQSGIVVIDRKKKRRTNHLEKFLNDNSEYYKFQNPESRLRFQEAPVQPYVGIIKSENSINVSATTTTNVHVQTSISMPTNMEDRAGDTEFHGQQKFELSSVVSDFRFAFERIPSQETWYATFQRQDDSRESVFEYWGNTTYRKLPFELGPLPPLMADCCILSKLNITKKDKRQSILQKNRGKVPNKFQNAAPKSEDTPLSYFIDYDSSVSKIQPCSASERKSSNENCVLDEKIELTQSIRKKHNIIYNQSNEIFSQRQKSNSNKNSECRATSSTNMSFESISMTKPIGQKNPLAIDMKTDSNSNSSCDSAQTCPDRPTSELSLSKKLALLGEYNQPRKSPREHASTLAILSCLVQQRKKREKELNGGISPEPIDIKPTLELGNDITSNASYQFMNVQAESSKDYETPTASKIAIKQEADTENKACPYNDEIKCLNNFNRQQREELPIKTEINHFNQNDVNNLDYEGDDYSKQNKIANVRMKGDRISGAEFKVPKVPNLFTQDVDPKSLCRELDILLNNAYQCKKEFLDNMPITTNSTDLVLISSMENFSEILSSVDRGPLRYGFTSQLKKRHGLSSFMRGGKRRRNKTGWPTVPKRRANCPKTLQLDEIEESCYNSNSNTDTEDTEEDRLLKVDVAEQHLKQVRSINCVDKTANEPPDERFITLRPKLNSHGEDCSKDDDGSNEDNNSVIFASSSDKAENSDIFTVSSDSLDTILNETSQPSNRVECIDVKSSLANIVSDGDDDNNDGYNDDNTSSDVTLAELLKKQIGVDKRIVSLTPHQKRTFKKLKKMSKTNVNNSCSMTMVSSQKISIELPKMQPIVCVKKIDVNNVSVVNETDQCVVTTELIKQSMIPIITIDNRNNVSPDSLINVSDIQQTTSNEINLLSSPQQPSLVLPQPPTPLSPPPVLFSPRKLRKPRGRWYRER